MNYPWRINLSFKVLNLSNRLITTLEQLGYHTPTEIQKRAIPILLKRKDLLATSQTGTGKTAAFVLPMLENLPQEQYPKKGDERYKIKALILAPTRELVLQIHHKIEEYAKEYTHQSVPLYGGVKLGSQIKAIRAGVNIAVGTTGRVLDHLKNGSLNLSKVEMIILDEADKMLEMGFIDDIRTILAKLPKKRQSIMFSATFPKELMGLAKSFLKNPTTIEIDRESLSGSNIEQRVHYVNEEKKLSLLLRLIAQNQKRQLLIFSNTKRQANSIVEYLKSQQINALAIHGDKSQNMREEVLKAFKAKELDILVATDVAARGVDIRGLPCVINFELPNSSEDYIHRIGRTGRAAQKGVAISLICEKEIAQLKEIASLVNQKLLPITTEGFEYTPKCRAGDKKYNVSKGINLKKAKEIAQKMMEKDKNNKKSKTKKPINRRHF